MKTNKPTKYRYYKLKGNFEEIVKTFCSRLWGWRKDIRFEVLNEEEYKKFDRKNNSTALVTRFREKHKVLGIDQDVYIIRLLNIGKGFRLNDLMHELLHVYRPQDSEKDVEQTQDWLLYGFQIWKSLYNNESLREYFIELFRKDFLRPKEKKIWNT